MRAPLVKIEYDNTYVLRPLEVADLEAFEKARIHSLPELRVFMEWAHSPKDRFSLLDRTLVQQLNYFRGDEYEFGLFEKATRNFLHHSGFYRTLRINPNCFEIGYWTVTGYEGRGLATLATQIQIALIFEYVQGDRIEITCNLENKASLRVIEKCGFHFEGKLRNFYRAGTEEMFAHGYCQERSAALFSLLAEDRTSLPWYYPLLDKLLIYPLLESPRRLYW